MASRRAVVRVFKGATRRERSDSRLILGTGLIALDVVLTPSEKEEPKLCAGGTCGNVLAILAHFGWRAYPVGNLGVDFAGRRVLKDLKQLGVREQFLRLSANHKTPVIVERIWRSANGEGRHRFFWRCPNCGAWLPRYRAISADEADDIARRAAAPDVFFFDRASQGAIQLARFSAKKGALVVFEPSRVGDKELFEDALSVAHIVKYSHDRLGHVRRLDGSPNLLLEIETFGEEGLRYQRCHRRSWVGIWKEMQAYRVDGVVDMAGAGDWCTAGMLHALSAKGVLDLRLAEDGDIEESLRFGQALAAVNCRYEGARGAAYGLTKKELQKTVKELLEGQRLCTARAGSTDGRLKNVFAALCEGCGERLETTAGFRL